MWTCFYEIVELPRYNGCNVVTSKEEEQEQKEKERQQQQQQRFWHDQKTEKKEEEEEEEWEEKTSLHHFWCIIAETEKTTGQKKTVWKCFCLSIRVSGMACQHKQVHLLFTSQEREKNKEHEEENLLSSFLFSLAQLV